MKRNLGLIVALSMGVLGCENTTTHTSRPGNGSTTGSSEVTNRDPENTGTGIDSRTDAPVSGGTTDPQDMRKDNTGVNVRDRDGGSKLPINQDENQSAINTTATIRSRVLEIDNLSVSGRNVKIITQDGKVTLRGPVANEGERSSIERIAGEVAGPENVTSQLEIAP